MHSIFGVISPKAKEVIQAAVVLCLEEGILSSNPVLANVLFFIKD
jgi:hypothetical protein